MVWMADKRIFPAGANEIRIRTRVTPLSSSHNYFLMFPLLADASSYIDHPWISLSCPSQDSVRILRLLLDVQFDSSCCLSITLIIYNLTHMMSIIYLMVNDVKTPRINSEHSLKKEFTELIHMNS